MLFSLYFDFLNCACCLLFLQSGLRTVFGIGNYTCHKICAEVGFHPDTRFQNMRHSIPDLMQIIEARVAPKSLQLRAIGEDIQHKIKSHSYQGMRHQYCLPVHGQKVHNHKTQQKLGLLRARVFSFPLAKASRKKNKK